MSINWQRTDWEEVVELFEYYHDGYSGDTLEMVEYYAEDQKLFARDQRFIASARDLSELFDREFSEWVYENRDDPPALREAFNNWTDGLCRDGVIHPEQYDKYGYVGEYKHYFGD